MISGVVLAGEAWIRLKIRGPEGEELIVKAIIDTGYTGWLTLPASIIEALALPWQDTVPGTLADGSEVHFNVHEATAIWDRRQRQIFVDEADSTPLVGMTLMKGYELNIKVRQRGRVTIQRLP